MPRVELHYGDAQDVLRNLIAVAEPVHAIVTDPPYHLESVVQRFGRADSAPAQFGSDGRFTRQSRGFMGKQWDGAHNGVRIAFDPEFWRLCWEVLPPGGFLVAFGGSRTYHRMAAAIEDAGFITHPMFGWIYGQGMTKAHSVIRKAPCADEWRGWYYGLQTAKPALEPIYVGQKPFGGVGFKSILKHGVGAFNVEACRVEVPGAKGRWPANVLHDGSEDVLAEFPDAPGQFATVTGKEPGPKTKQIYGKFTGDREPAIPRKDSGSAARFFYCAKPNPAERNDSEHPTIKPNKLLRWLCRFVARPGSVILDPFAGSGSTARAALDESMRAILIEREMDYALEIASRFELRLPIDAETLAFLEQNETLL